MSRVIIFSRFFPAYHPKVGQETFFVEKFWQSLYVLGQLDNCWGGGLLEKELENFSNPSHFIRPKNHTIRVGNRWKVGDKFSPRVWSGKPYASKQIIIAPDIEIKKIWDVHIEFIGSNIHVMIPKESKTNEYFLISAGDVAKNDGLNVHDFIEWFKIHPKKKEKFIGQIICWNENIDYLTLGT